MGLQDYLAFCIQALERLQEFPVVHVVLCNEACDLDSAVSAIVYAYFLHETSLAPVGTALFLPLLNIPRSDFPLRTEVAYFLGKFGISTPNLIFRDDLDLAKVKVTSDLKVTLVDHHVLSGMAMAEFEGNVVQILDHRPREGELADRCDSTIELVGSCSTLVAEALLGEETFSMDPVCATLLYGTIVTDTINFSPAAGKTTAKDLDIAERLEDIVEGGADREALFNEIHEAKFDLSGLSSKEILQKDLKMVSGDSLMVAMSSVTMDMKALTEREDFEVSLKTFAQDKQVDAVVVLSLCMRPNNDDDGGIARQLGIFSPSRVYRQQMADVLNASQSPNLGLCPLPSSLEDFPTFSQSNVKASRKQILPIIKAFLAGETTPDETQMDAYDLPKDQSEGFTSMSSIVGTRQNTSEGDISSEDLISRDDSMEEDLLPAESLLPTENLLSTENLLPTEENLLPAENLLPMENLLPLDHKVFDPLSSVHSSDSAATSPQDGNRNADDGLSPDQQLASCDEITVDVLNQQRAVLLEDSNSGGVMVEGEGGGGGGSMEEEGGVSNSAVSLPADGGSDYASSSPTTAQELPHPSPPPLLLSTPSPPPPQEASNNPASFNNNNNNDERHNNGLPSPQHQEEGEDGLQQQGENNLQHDFLDMASPHDLLFPADSPLDVSAATSGQVSGQTSGQTSGHASKAPSYPVTPPNSYMEDGVMSKEVHLPSFNSSEMVEKIQEKKAALGASGSEDTDPLSPFTPQNSYVDNPFSKETHLPSFHSSDMVERIREKRTSMEREVQGAETLDNNGAMLDVEQSPFTPHNSYVEGGFDAYARDHLPSLNNAEIASRIRQKQAELTAAAGGGHDSGTASPLDDNTCSPAAPYTPQNSFRDSPFNALNQDSHVTDLNEVAERLSLTGSESSGSLNEPKSVKASNRVHMQGLSPQEAAAGFPLCERNDSEASSSVRSGSEVSQGMTSSSMGVKRKGVSFSQQNQEEDSDNVIAEEAIQKIAYELANEMIQKALETFPSESVKELVPPGATGGDRLTHPSISEDSSPTMDESDQDLSSSFSPDVKPSEEEAVGTPDSALASSTESEQFAAHFSSPPLAMKASSSLADELAQALSSSKAGENSQDVSDEDEDSSHQFSQEGGRGVDMPKSGSFENSQDMLRDEGLSHRLSEEGGRGVPKSRSYENSRDVSSSDSPRRLLSEGGSGAGVPKTQSYEIETEYLCDMDPMHKMGVFHQDANLIETDADKEVVEGASFRKISGQEYQGVQEEILEEIRQEARDREMNQLQRSSVAEEENDEAGVPPPTTTDDDDEAATPHPSSEGKKKIALESDLNLDDSLTDEQGKKTLRAARDKELYASALENQRAVIDTRDQAVLEPSDASHPLMETPDDRSSGEEQQSKTKIQAPGSRTSEDHHHYESFVETGSVDNAEERLKTERRNSERTGRVARTVSAASETSLKGVELCDEWQDDELPKMLGAEAQALPDDPLSHDTSGETNRKRLVPEQGLVADDLENVEVVDSDSEIDSDMDNEQLEWENDTPVRTPAKRRAAEPEEEIPQYTAAEERRDAMNWKIVKVGDGTDFRLDMRVIEPYKRVLSHGGYCGEGLTAMIVFSACYLPSRDRRDYSYVMNHLFHYVLHTLDELVADDYMIVYFHGATPRRQMPSFSWLKKCYQAIDRRLKKNLKALYLVHPTLWLKTVVLMTRPFISVKFSSKLQFVRTLYDLKRLIPMEYVYIPEIVQRYDDRHFHPPPPSSSSSSTLPQ